VWTQDSNTIYYSLDVAPGAPVDDDIYKKAADNSGNATPVVTGTTDDYQPAISPDGQSLCFTRGTFGTTQATVQRSTIQGTDVIEIANSMQGDYNCAWSPDGTKIAYVQGIFGLGDLMVMNSDGTGFPTALVPNVAGRFDGNPDWTRNPSPACQDLTVTVRSNTRTSIPLRCTDPPPENDPLTQAIVDQPGHGSVGAIANSAVTYAPARNFTGKDQFTYKANDGTSDSNVATIHVTVAKDVAAAISALNVRPSRWRLGSRKPQISRRPAPTGTTISFRLSKAAKVTLTFARARTGRRVNGRCVAPRRSNRTRRSCTRYVDARNMSISAHTGLNRVRFQGVLPNGKRLSVGSYRLTVGATDAAGLRSRSRTTTFTIVRR
jgi:Bacterial Ig domain/WD40-like Beta Propeller Repeat